MGAIERSEVLGQPDRTSSDMYSNERAAKRCDEMSGSTAVFLEFQVQESCIDPCEDDKNRVFISFSTVGII
jgi:hypothetical protein